MERFVWNEELYHQYFPFLEQERDRLKEKQADDKEKQAKIEQIKNDMTYAN